MKNLKLLTIAMLIFVLSILSVNAYFDLTDVTLGGSSQDRAKNISASTTITNRGPLTIQNVQVSFPGVDASYKVSGSLSGTSIAPNSSVTLTVVGYVPLGFDAVDSNGKQTSFDIGDIKLTGTYTNSTPTTKTVNLLMQAANKLDFDSKKLKINDGGEKTLTDKTYDVRRGDTIELSVEVKNKFSSSGDCQDDGKDCDIEDIQLDIIGDDALDVDDSVDYDTIRAGRTKTETFTFTVPDDIDEGDYDVELLLTGDDENGAMQGNRLTFTLNVEVPNDEVTITDYDLSPSTLDCTNRKAMLTVTVENTGNDDQDKISLLVQSTKLNLDESIDNIALDSGDDTTKTFALTFPSKLTAGQYFIQIIGNVDFNDETDRQVATLTVPDCTPAPTQPQIPYYNNTVPQNNTGVNVITVPPTSGVIYGKPTQTSFYESSQFVLLLGALFVIALMLFLILLVVLIRK